MQRHNPNANGSVPPAPANSKAGMWIDLALILTVGTLVLLLHYQGWRSQEMANLDMLPYFSGTRDFLKTGKIPERGEISSYGSFNPPGTFFLMIPGMVLTSDPRLQDLAGTALLLYGTLVFLYLAARELGGRAVALSAAILFGASRLGFIGLWPVGHPIFIIAPLYFLILWVKKRASWRLGAALAILAFGLYVDLAIIPFLFVLPVLWLVYRPPVGWKSLLASVLFSLLVWFPYLRFEAERGFVDLASILLLRPVDSIEENSASDPIYCYSAMPGENDEPNDIYLPYIGGPEIEQRVIYPLAGWKNQAAYRICRTLLNIDRNFDTDLFALGANRLLNTVLWWIFMAGWLALAWTVVRSWRGIRQIVELGRRKAWIPLALAAAGALIFYWLLNPDLVANFAADKSLDRNVSLAVEQARGFVPWLWLAVCLGWFLSTRVPERKPDHAILFIAFTLPWLVLVIMGEPGRPERFWFMWPLQVWVTVQGLRWAAERFRRANFAHAILAAALAAVLLPVPFYAERISDAQTNGYSGRDNDQWKVIEFLAGKAGSGAERSLWVGYWMVDSHSLVDPGCPVCRNKDWFDYILESNFNVTNLASISAEPPEGGSWVVVDRNMGLPDSVGGLEPETIVGHYSVYWIP
jgi:hypothetical protein